MTQENTVAKPPKYYTEPERIDVGGLPVAYRRKGSGETVLFLHGAGFTRMWTPFYEAMSEEFDFIAPEHPGFGETPFPEWLGGFEDLVQHYDQFLAKLGVEEFHLVGFSIGGWLAAEFATYYPRRMKSLTLVNPMGLPVDWPIEDDMFAIGPQQVQMRVMNDSKAAEDYFFPGEPPMEEVVQGYGEASTAARLAWTPRYNLAMERRLAAVTCPSNIILAENDRLIPETIGRRYAELLPNCSIDTIPGTGHAVFCDRPQESRATISKFLKGVAK